MQKCTTCSTPLDPDGQCVTCAAASEGLVPMDRLDYSSIREMMTLLEEAGLSPQMERVPAANEQEKRQPRWNLYLPRDEAQQGARLLHGDWRSLLGDDAAVEAARRGVMGVDLDAGAEITCPACGHTFLPEGEVVECPDCGLGLGAPDRSVGGPVAEGGKREVVDYVHEVEGVSYHGTLSDLDGTPTSTWTVERGAEKRTLDRALTGEELKAIIAGFHLVSDRQVDNPERPLDSREFHVVSLITLGEGDPARKTFLVPDPPDSGEVARWLERFAVPVGR